MTSQEASKLLLATLVVLVVVVTFGFWWGLQVGTYRADIIGPQAACETIRWSFYDCTKFTR